MVLVNAMIPRPGETPGEWWGNTGHAEAKRQQNLRDGRRADAPFDPLDAARPAPRPRRPFWLTLCLRGVVREDARRRPTACSGRRRAPPLMRSARRHDVAAVVDAYPTKFRRKLLALRTPILETAKSTDGVGEIEEMGRACLRHVAEQERKYDSDRLEEVHSTRIRHLLPLPD